MARILCIDTSTKVCSVALFSEGILLAQNELFLEKSHSAYLPAMIKESMAYLEWPMSSLDAIAVSRGPGSYTGLRIGVSTVKGLCFACDLPLIALGNLHAMAYSMSKFNVYDALLCPMVDARRMEVYAFLTDNNLNKVEDVRPVIIDQNSYSTYLEEREIIFFGNGADKCRGVINKKNATIISGISPSATGMGQLALEKFREKQFEDLAYFEPEYLKPFMTKKPKNQQSCKKSIDFPRSGKLFTQIGQC